MTFFGYITEKKWSDKYKKSIDCDNPKGFSQRAHCQGRKKKLNEVYKDSGLGKWFGKGGEGGTTKGGWDRYNAQGEKIGKCGDAKKGEGYAACLSAEKAAKLGKEGRASFVRRKRRAQSKAGDPKKGKGEKGETRKGKGKKPVNVATGAAKKKKIKESILEAKRIPRKKGQPANSKKHSDLYTDENPKGTIHGLKFATETDARKSVSKIEGSGKKHAHKIQAAIAMEQRARAAKKTGPAKVYRSYIEKMKKKTKKMNETYMFEETKKVKAPDGYHWMKNKEGYKLMKHAPKSFKAHTNASLQADFEVQKVHTESVIPSFCEFITEASKNVPTNPELWSRAKAAAKKKFDVYPSAYANAWASKWYKKRGGGWKKKKS